MFLNESGTDGAKVSGKAASGRRVASPIRSLVNIRDLQLGVLESCMKLAYTCSYV